jgi:hypothetical protein
MLGVFQQVIKSIGENGEKTLVGFDKMYEGIRNELRGEIQSSVIMAERNLSSDFAIRVLKTLFLVKYFSNFKPTKRNISVLLIDSMEMDLKGHEVKVQEALNLLENQSYIQRNGEIFEFLTDDEKDIEQEIKDTDIDDQAVIQQLKELFFDEIIKDNKIPYTDNKQSYDFTSKIDGATIGREKELAVEIISENYADYSNTTYIASQTMGSSMMRLVLPANAIFIKDLKMYLKTNKYIKQSQSTTSKVERRRIIQDKQVQNSERRRNLILLSNQLLAGSDVYINGTKQEMGANSDGKSRVVQAFQILVKTVYSNLRMLGVTTYTEDTIKQILHTTQNELFKIEQTLTEAETEILTIINRRKMRSDRSSLSELKDILGSKPYGWYPNAVWSVTAKLYKRGQIELKQDSNMLEGGDVLQAFLNSAQYSNTLVQAQEAEDPEAVRALKSLYADFLDESCPFTIGKEMALSFKEKLREVLRETERFYMQRSEYPFLSALASPLEKLKNLVSKDYMQLLSQVKSYQDELLDFKELLLDPIKRFMNSEQCGIYDDIRKTLNGDKSNFEYTTGDELEILRQLLDHPKPYEGSLIREAKAAKDSLAEKVITKIDEERKLTSETIYNCVNTLKTEIDFEKLSPAEQADILEPFSEETKKVQNQRYIAILRESRSRIKNVILTNQLNEINRKSHVPETRVGEKPRAEIVKVISVGSVKVNFPKSQLKTDADVDAYVEALREEYKKQIQNNRRISL